MGLGYNTERSKSEPRFTVLRASVDRRGWRSTRSLSDFTIFQACTFDTTKWL